MEIATFAGGCFWCTEAIFQMLKGVKKVISGYCGGDMDNPSYDQVSSGITHHAESIQITFDPKIIKYKDLLYVFMKTHDPTTLNRQGHDVGTQYRSAIFYHSDSQKKAAETAIADMQKENQNNIVTEVLPFQQFYEAEDYHQNYYNNNKDKPYCMLVIDPKIKALKKEFKSFLKK
jgi:peptide-methionine (S)-S-oxide reductase